MPYKGLLRTKPLWGFIYALGFLLPVSGSINPFMLIWSDILSSSNWFCMYALIAFLLRPTVSTCWHNFRSMIPMSSFIFP